MFRLIFSSFAWLGVSFRSRNNSGLEILALRQQAGILNVSELLEQALIDAGIHEP